jgi:hypothetical protein
MSKLFYFLLFIFSITFFSCGKGDRALPKSSGKEGEILIIIDQQYWNHPIGDSIKNFFQQDFIGLPQSEPWFKLYKIFPKDFTLSFKTAKNILIFSIDPKHPVGQPTLEIGYDNWAKDQLVIRLTCNHPNEFQSAFEQKRNRMVELFKQKDNQRFREKYRKTLSADVDQQLKEKLQLSMTVPEGFYVNSQGENFMYLVHDAMKNLGGLQHQITRGIFIHTFPYTDTKTYSKNFLFSIRDSLTKIYVQGKTDSSYMKIEMLFPPDTSITKMNDMYAMETRGLWKMENYFMGGPFLNYIVYDEKNKRIILIDGFVFAPRFDKRDYMLQLEGILQSIQPI